MKVLKMFMCQVVGNLGRQTGRLAVWLFRGRRRYNLATVDGLR